MIGLEKNLVDVCYKIQTRLIKRNYDSGQAVYDLGRAITDIALCITNEVSEEKKDIIRALREKIYDDILEVGKYYTEYRPIKIPEVIIEKLYALNKITTQLRRAFSQNDLRWLNFIEIINQKGQKETFGYSINGTRPMYLKVPDNLEEHYKKFKKGYLASTYEFDIPIKEGYDWVQLERAIINEFNKK